MLYIRGSRKYLNSTERLRFYKAARSIRDRRKRCFCLILFYTGCRISEALNLTPLWIDPSDRVVVFKTLKQRNVERFRAIPIPKELLLELAEYATESEIAESVRLWPYSRTWGWKCIKACMADARLSGIKATPKGLRHAFGISCVENSVPVTDIQELMGHARIETTKIYLTLVGKERHAMVGRTWPKSARN